MKQKNRPANHLSRIFTWRSASFWAWLAVSAILVIPAYLSIHFNMGWPTPINALRSLIRGEPQSSTTFSAKHPLQYFTVLTQNDIDVHSPSHAHDAEERKLLGRITLRDYQTGDEIHLEELGPQLAPGVQYQVQDIDVPDSLGWLRPGDTASFVLIETSCLSNTRPAPSSTPTSSSTTSTCLPIQTTRTNSPNLLNAVILENGTMEKDGLMSFLVAIPTTGGNQDALSLLDRDPENVIAYLMVKVQL